MTAILLASMLLGGVHYDTSIGSCMPLSGGAFSDDASVCFGDSSDYCITYDSTATQWEFWSTDTDGAGANGNVWVVPDGTDDATFEGLVQLTGTSGAFISSPSADQLRIGDASSPTDDIIIDVTGDAFKVYEGDGATLAIVNAGGIGVSGTVSSGLTSGSNFVATNQAGSTFYLGRSEPGATLPVNGERSAAFIMRGSNSTPTANQEYARIEAYLEEVTAGDIDGSLLFQVANDDSMTTVLTIDATDGTENVTSAWPVSVTGAVTASTDIQAGATGNVYFTGRGFVSSPSADQIRIGDAASPTDDIIIDVTSDAATFYQGDGMTRANLFPGSVYSSGSYQASSAGGVLWASRAYLSSPAADQLRIADSGTPTDDIIIDVTGDAATFYQGDGSTPAATNTGALGVTGALTATSSIRTDSGSNFVATNANGATVYLSRTDNTPTNDDLAASLIMRGYNDAPTANQEYARIEAYAEEVATGDIDGSLLFRVVNDDSMTTVLTIDATDGTESVTSAWPLTVSTGNVIVSSGTVAAGANLQAGATAAVNWNGRAYLSSPSADQLRIGDAASPTDDIIIDVTSDEASFYQGNGSTRAALNVGSINALSGSARVAAGGNFYWTGRVYLSAISATQMRIADAASPTNDIIIDVTSDVMTVYQGDGATNASIDVGAVQVDAAAKINWAARTEMISGTDGHLTLRQADDSTGVTLDALTADTLTIRNQAADDVGNLDVTGTLTVGSFTHHIDVPVGAAVLGPTAPSPTLQDGMQYLAFTDGDQGGGQAEVPDCWDATSDLSLDIYWAAESGDAIANGETVIWNCDYRVITWESDTTAGGNATAVSVADTYTEAGSPGTDKATHKSSLTIDYDHANHPVAAGDDIIFLCERDSGGTDTYSGAPMLGKFELKFNCIGIPNH